MATELHFRIANPEDAQSIRDLVQSAFGTEDSRPDWTGSAELAASFRVDLDQVRAKMKNPDTVTLMALNGQDALVGTIEVSRRDGGSCGRLSMIAVDDDYQRSGIGRRILSHAEKHCRQAWGVQRFSLNALSSRKALIAWYMRRGYRPTGSSSPFPRDKYPALDLPADLCFVEMDKEFAGGQTTSEHVHA